MPSNRATTPESPSPACAVVAGTERRRPVRSQGRQPARLGGRRTPPLPTGHGSTPATRKVRPATGERPRPWGRPRAFMSPRQVPEEAPRGRQALRNHVIQQVRQAVPAGQQTDSAIGAACGRSARITRQGSSSLPTSTTRSRSLTCSFAFHEGRGDSSSRSTHKGAGCGFLARCCRGHPAGGLIVQ